MDYSLPGSSVVGFPRQEYWSGLPFPFPGDLPNPGIKPVSCLGRQILYHWATWQILRVLITSWRPVHLILVRGSVICFLFFFSCGDLKILLFILKVQKCHQDVSEYACISLLLISPSKIFPLEHSDLSSVQGNFLLSAYISLSILLFPLSFHCLDSYWIF